MQLFSYLFVYTYSTDVFGYNASNPESAPLELENDDCQNQGESQHLRRLSILDKNSNMCDLHSSDDSFILVEKSCKVPVSQSMNEKQSNCFDNSDECLLHVEIKPKSPEMQFERTDDYMIRKDLSPERSPWCLDAKNSNNVNENSQDIDTGSAQCKRASGCLDSISPQNAPALTGENLELSNNRGDLAARSVESRNDAGGSVLEMDEELSEASSTNQIASYVAMEKQRSSSNELPEEVENNDKRSIMVRSSKSGTVRNCLVATHIAYAERNL